MITMVAPRIDHQNNVYNGGENRREREGIFTKRSKTNGNALGNTMHDKKKEEGGGNLVIKRGVIRRGKISGLG